ncbi:MAG: hypothetical protein KC419_17120 [Anaerolineales bacterium]|nr:hypothetical protein [Anaerolineales bacterium]
MSWLWVLRGATATKDGKIDTWDWSPYGDGKYTEETPLEFIAENELDEMGDNSSHRVIVNQNGNVLKWITNSPKGKRRRWW